MKYDKCLSCKQLDNGTCDGPNFLTMDALELGEWCDAKRRTIHGMTYDRIAAETGISKTAVYNFLKGTHQDYRLETIRPIVKYITGGKWDDNPCGNITNNEKASYENRIENLERQLEQERNWRDDKIAHIMDENRKINDEYKEATTFLRAETKRKNRVIMLLVIMAAVFVFAAVAATIVDITSPELGFFWLG